MIVQARGQIVRWNIAFCMYMYSLLFPHSNILAWVCDPIGQTDGRTASHLTTKCFRSMGYQILLGMRLRLHAIGAQELHF